MDRCSPNKTTLLWTVWSPRYKLSGLYKCLIVLLCCLLTGISGKSQVLFALVFTTRYLDLLTSFISLYNTTMKVKHSRLSLHPAGLFPSIKHTVFRLNKYTKSTHLCLLKDDVSQQDVTNWLCSIIFVTDQRCFIFHDLDNVVCVSQVIYIGCAYATVYLIYLKFKATYDGNHDTFRVEFLVVPVGGLAFLVNHDFSPLEVRNTAQTLFDPFHTSESECDVDSCHRSTPGCHCKPSIQSFNISFPHVVKFHFCFSLLVISTRHSTPACVCLLFLSLSSSLIPWGSS